MIHPRAVPGDVLRALLVKDAMTSHVHSVSPGFTLLAAAQEMRGHHVSGVPVVDPDGRVVGVLSERDIVNDLHRAAGVGSLRGLLDLILGAQGFGRRDALGECLRRLKQAKVADAMTPKPITVEEGATLGEAARLLRQYSVNRLPVVDSKSKLTGIITRHDVLRSLGGGPERRTIEVVAPFARRARVDEFEV